MNTDLLANHVYLVLDRYFKSLSADFAQLAEILKTKIPQTSVLMFSRSEEYPQEVWEAFISEYSSAPMPEKIGAHERVRHNLRADQIARLYVFHNTSTEADISVITGMSFWDMAEYLVLQAERS